MMRSVQKMFFCLTPLACFAYSAGLCYAPQLHDAAEWYAKAALLPGAPGYTRRFAAYELALCPGHEREAYSTLRALYNSGEKERLPTLLRRLKELEIKLDIPPGQRVP